MGETSGFKDRITACRRLAARRGASHVLITDPKDVTYLSGFYASSAHCLISAKSVTIISDFRYEESLQSFCRRNRQYSFLISKQNSFAYLSSLRPAVRALGIQSNVVTLDQYLRLARKIRPARIIRLGDALWAIPVSKTAAELACIRRAARIGVKALKAWLARLTAGMTEIAAARLLERLCADYGSEKPSFDTIVLFGARSSLVHGTPSSARLKRGDWIMADFGCMVRGFCSDMTRTFVFGRAGDRQRRMYAVVQEAQERARKTIRPGITAGSVDDAARMVIDKAGYADNFGHATGHGLGLRIHENPRLARGERFILPQGAVVTVEPGVYVRGFGGCRIEDTVVVTKSGADVLTPFPRRLIELTKEVRAL
jgi:Xaa-Pro aminopeptidase